MAGFAVGFQESDVGLVELIESVGNCLGGGAPGICEGDHVVKCVDLEVSGFHCLVLLLFRWHTLKSKRILKP